MAGHSVHRSTETGNFVVVKDGQILHTFPTEGEAEAQVRSLDAAEEAATKPAKAEAKPEKAEANDRPHGRHR